VSKTFYEYHWEKAGELGYTLDYDNHILRQGTDLVVVYGGQETVRVRPDNSALLTIPTKIVSGYIQRWLSKVGSRFGISSMKIKQNITKGKFFELTMNNKAIQYKENTIEATYTSDISSSSSSYNDHRGKWQLAPPKEIALNVIDTKGSRKLMKEFAAHLKTHEASLRVLGITKPQQFKDFYKFAIAGVEVPHKVTVVEMLLDLSKITNFVGLITSEYWYGEMSPARAVHKVKLLINKHKAAIYAHHGLVT
jgi:hypothetical protein